MEEDRIRFAFDYVDPGSYLLHSWIRRWEGRGEPLPPLEWVPLELRPPSTPPLDPEAEEWEAMARSLEELARESGIEMERPSVLPRSRKAHELALHAREKGRHREVHDALFLAHFRRGQDLGRVDVLVALAEETGMDPAEVRTVLGVDRFLPEVRRLREELLAAGVRGVPTLEWSGGRRSGERMEGMVREEDLRAFLERSGPDANSEAF